jgi:hypothetical protein
MELWILYTDSRTPWTGDQPCRKAATCAGQRKAEETHPCLRPFGYCDRNLHKNYFSLIISKSLRLLGKKCAEHNTYFVFIFCLEKCLAKYCRGAHRNSLASHIPYHSRDDFTYCLIPYCAGMQWEGHNITDSSRDWFLKCLSTLLIRVRYIYGIL